MRQKNNQFESQGKTFFLHNPNFWLDWKFGLSFGWESKTLCLKRLVGSNHKPNNHSKIYLDRSPKSLRYSSKWSDDEPFMCYCSRDNHFLDLDYAVTELLNSWFLPNISCYQRIQMNCSDDKIKILCDLIFNVVYPWNNLHAKIATF